MPLSNLIQDIRQVPEIRLTINHFIKWSSKNCKDERTFKFICGFFKDLSKSSEDNLANWVLENGNRTMELAYKYNNHVDSNIYDKLDHLISSILYYLCFLHGKATNMLKEIYDESLGYKS